MRFCEACERWICTAAVGVVSNNQPRPPSHPPQFRLSPTSHRLERLSHYWPRMRNLSNHWRKARSSIFEERVLSKESSEVWGSRGRLRNYDKGLASVGLGNGCLARPFGPSHVISSIIMRPDALFKPRTDHTEALLRTCMF